MEDYKSNSHKAKETAESEKKMTKVVKGTTTTRKKSELQKVADVFIYEDVSKVKNYILMDVLVPAIKKGLYDIVTGGADMILYGGSGGGNNRSERSGSKVSYISYDKKYRNLRDEPRDSQSVRTRTGIDYDDIVFNNRGDAERVLASMDAALDQYDFITINDMYDLADITSNNYMLDKYGWTNIRSAEVVRVREGYVIKMPKPHPLDR